MEAINHQENKGMTMKENDMLSRDERGWYFDKRISVANILAMLSLAGMLAAWQWAVSERVTVNAQGIAKHEAVVDVQYKGVQVQLQAMRERDKELMMEWVRQNQDIIRRLERIEDTLQSQRSSKNG